MIYLAGKISGDPLYYTKFLLWERDIKEQGLEVYNPARIIDNPVVYDYVKNNSDRAVWRFCMRMVIKNLRLCDTIAMLPKWQDSRGARFEHWIAKRRGLKIIYLGCE